MADIFSFLNQQNTVIKIQQDSIQKIIQDFHNLPNSQVEKFDYHSIYQGKALSLDDMEYAIEYEAGLQK